MGFFRLGTLSSPCPRCTADSADFPWWPPGGRIGPRALAGSMMLVEAHNYIRSHFPYWDRNGGRDHIVVSA